MGGDMSENLSVTLTPEKLHVTPGGSVEAVATIRNVGDVVEAYSIEIEGVEPQWVTLSVLSASLFPGDEAQVQLGIQLPRSSEVKAGRYEVRLKVISKRDPSVQSTVEVALDVEGFLLFDVGLRPKKVRGRKGTYQVGITNSGNVKTTYTLGAQDPDEKWQFKLRQDTVVVDPGSTVDVPLVVKPRKSPLLGRPKTQAFNVNVAPQATGVSDAKPKSVEGQLECMPVMPVWAIAAAAVALVVILAVVLVFALSSPPDTEAPVLTLSGHDQATDQAPVTVTVDSDDGDIRLIQVFLNDELVKECNSAPCTYSTPEPYPAGTELALTVKAFDKSDNEERVDEVVMVGRPDVKLTVEATLASEKDLERGESDVLEYIKFEITAKDENSVIESIEMWTNRADDPFLVAGETCESSPCQVVGGPYHEGTVEYYARALDAQQIQLTSTERQELEIADTPPDVFIEVSPAEPTADDTVTFTARARDAGGVERIEVHTPVGTRACEGIALSQEGEWFTCSRSVSGLTAGTYEYWAFAYDDGGKRGRTGRVAVEVAEAPE
jgi:hypothetical protein